MNEKKCNMVGQLVKSFLNVQVDLSQKCKRSLVTTEQREMFDVLYIDPVDIFFLNITVSYRTDGGRPNYIGNIK